MDDRQPLTDPPNPRHTPRSPLGVGLVVSGIVHLLAILFYAFLGIPTPPEFSVAPTAEAGPEVAGTQIVRIVEALAELDAPPEVPDEEEPIDESAEEREAPEAVTPGLPARISRSSRCRRVLANACSIG